MARLPLFRLPLFGLPLRLPFWVCLLAFAVFWLLPLQGGATAQESGGYKIVVNSANTSTGESKSTLGKIFLKKIREWDNKVKVTPYDLDDKSEARKAFSDGVHGKSVSAIKSYWQRMIFSGRDVPPDEIASEADLLKRIAADKGAIGYVSARTTLPEGVKELKVKDE
jgi:ABC-type phosphate transport system substrate-binding protein